MRGAKPGNKNGLRHGHSPKGRRSPEYQCWQDMKARCLNPNHEWFDHYGGRGIIVCDRWRDSFCNFLLDVGRRPTSKHTIDRFPDNDGNYEPGNVRWATRGEQNANRRTTRFVMVNGRRMPLSDVIKSLGLNRRLVCSRIEQGWTPERAIAEPARWHRPDLAERAR